jgi:hypothetical protein
VLGGISTGQDIKVSLAIKPTSSIRTARESIDKAGSPASVETFGRHDPCVGIRATPIAEAMLALVLMDHALRHRAQCGDVRVDTPRIPAQAPGKPEHSRFRVDRPGDLSPFRTLLSRLLRLCRRDIAVRQPVFRRPGLFAGADRRADGLFPAIPHRGPVSVGLART